MVKKHFISSPSVEEISETDKETKIIAKELVSAL